MFGVCSKICEKYGLCALSRETAIGIYESDENGARMIQVERTWDLVRDSGQRKLTSSFQNHCTLHSVPVGAKPLSPRQCAPSRSIYLSRRLNSHWEILVTTHHLQKWESQLRLRWTEGLIGLECRWFNCLKSDENEYKWHYFSPERIIKANVCIWKLKNVRIKLRYENE